jgi:hypothetical protein
MCGSCQAFQGLPPSPCSGPGKTKTDEQVPHCAGAQAERRSAHRTVGHLFVSFGFTKSLAAPWRWRRSQSLKRRTFTPWRSCLTEVSLNSVAAKAARLVTLSNVCQLNVAFPTPLPSIKWACTFRLIHGISSIIRLGFTIETVCSLWGGNWIAKFSADK